MGAYHGTDEHNVRFYYNPITSRIEPIGYDGHDSRLDVKINHLLCDDDYDWVNTRLKTKLFFEDPVVYRNYVGELERISNISYLDNLFYELDGDMQEGLNAIYKNYPWYHFSKNDYYENQKYINDRLNPTDPLLVYFKEYSQNNSIILLAKNNQSMPIEIIELIIIIRNISLQKVQIFFGVRKRTDRIRIRNLNLFYRKDSLGLMKIYLS